MRFDIQWERFNVLAVFRWAWNQLKFNGPTVNSRNIFKWHGHLFEFCQIRYQLLLLTNIYALGCANFVVSFKQICKEIHCSTTQLHNTIRLRTKPTVYTLYMYTVHNGSDEPTVDEDSHLSELGCYCNQTDAILSMWSHDALLIWTVYWETETLSITTMDTLSIQVMIE